MRLVDTSAWIEWLIGSPVGITVADELPDREQWVVAFRGAGKCPVHAQAGRMTEGMGLIKP